MMRRLMMSTVLAVCVAVPAAAQPAQPPEHNQSIGAGVQFAAPYGPGTAPGVQVSWRQWHGPRLGTGADFRWHNYDRISSYTISSYSLGVSVLGRSTAGRVSLIGGAGPGFFVERLPSQTLRSFGLQGLGEFDVLLTNHISVFAGLHIELRDIRHADNSSGYPTAGIRVAF